MKLIISKNENDTILKDWKTFTKKSIGFKHSWKGQN